MHLLETAKLSEESFSGKYIFLDNDFLSALFDDEQALSDLIILTKKGYLAIDSLTKFEFLQTTYLPQQQALKENFIENSIFTPIAEHQEIFKQIKENALELSYIYGHRGVNGASVVDLFLAARTLIYYPNAYIITGNRRDFPAFLFDTIGILNHENEKQPRAYFVLSYNKEKHESCTNDLAKIGKNKKS